MAQQLAGVLIEKVFSNYDIPNDIVSDRDKLFLLYFWQSAIKLFSVKIRLSTLFTPQIDRQTERINQTIKQYLQIFVNYK